MKHAFFCAAILVAACGGGGDGGDGGGSDGGGGGDDAAPTADGTPARRLALTGSCLAHNPNNQDNGAAFRVDCVVMLTRDGAPVELGQVRINPAPPGLQTQLLATDTPGEYGGYYLAYGGSARVSASQGGDEIPETPFPGPRIFQVTAPEGGATVPVATPLQVAWTNDGDVPILRIRTASGFVSEILPDDGAEQLPAGSIVGADVLTVTKTMSTSLGASAVAGSKMDFSLEVTRDVILEGTPLPDAAP